MSDLEHGIRAASCDLSILVRPHGYPIHAPAIPILVENSRFPFARRFFTVDTAPLGRRIGRRPYRTPESYRRVAKQCSGRSRRRLLPSILAGVPTSNLPEVLCGPDAPKPTVAGVPRSLAASARSKRARADFLVSLRTATYAKYRNPEVQREIDKEGSRRASGHPDLWRAARSGPTQPNGRLRHARKRPREAFEPDPQWHLLFSKRPSPAAVSARRSVSRSNSAWLSMRPGCLPGMLSHYLTSSQYDPEWE